VLNDEFVINVPVLVNLLIWWYGHILLQACAHDLPLRNLQLVQILTIYILQGSVATRLKCGGIFSDRFIANLLEGASVKEFLKSVNIWWRYEL